MSSPVAPEYPPGCKVRSSNPHEHVAILRSEHGLEAADPLTVGDVFLDTVKKFPDRAALCFKERDVSDWKEISYAEYYRFTLQAAKSFVKLGLEPLSPVAVIGFLSPECLYGYFGAIIAGGITIGLTIRLEGTPEGLTNMLNYCKAQFILAEDSKQVDRFLHIRNDAPHLKAIVQYNGELAHRRNSLYSWTEFMQLGSDIEDSVIEERMKQQRAYQCVSVVFSSGTTGNYKSALLTHDNLTWSAKMLHAGLLPGLGFGVDRFFTCSAPFFVSCLNLDLYLPMYCAATVYIAPPSSRCGLKECLPILRQINPTLFFGSASDWEVVKSVLEEEQAATPETAREFLGLQDCRVLLTAGVAVPTELLEYFKRLDMTLIEAYGMTENAGGITVNRVQQLKVGSVGQPYPGTYVRIDNPDHHGNGEILVLGRQRFMGYMYDEEGTHKAVDDKGWFHTGDIGHIDSDGCLFITGRINGNSYDWEMIVLSNGHNVPIHIEERIKKEIPFLSNVVLVGDGQDYVCCLVTLKTLSNVQTGEPLDRLTPGAQAQIAQLGSLCMTASEIVTQRDEVVYSAVQRGIDAANDLVYDTKDRVIKFTILEKDFSTFGGEIGGTMKLKRHVIKENCVDQINAMYT